MKSVKKQAPEAEVATESRKFYQAKNEDHFSQLETVISSAGYGLRDVLEHFPAFIQRRSLPRLLAHYELFKKIQNLPGSIVELGVYRGSGFFTWSNLLETFCPGDRTRKVYGFDHFEGLENHDKTVDGDLHPWLNHVVGNLKSSGEVFDNLVELHNNDNLLPGNERCKAINGDLVTTVPEFIAKHPGLRLSMLYFDVGLYQPTLIGLKHLYPLVVPGGLVVLNGYGMQPWEGEAQAVEEYFAEAGLPALEKFDFSPIPHAYFVK